MKFTKLELSEDIQKAIDKLGFEETTEIQERTIPLIMQGMDIIGKSQTGSGKTFAYGIPAIEKVDTADNCVQILVVCPTRELASQVCDEFRKLTEFRESCKVVPVFGGSDMERQKRNLKTAKIVIGTPGRLMDHLRRKTLKLHNLKMVVLDEADEMLNMGFKEDIETILKTTNNTHQTTMFSATMPKPILEITKLYMKEPQLIELSRNNETSKKIKQLFVDGDKKEALIRSLEEFNPTSSIIFCNTKKMVDDTLKFLQEKGYKAIGIHGDMRQGARKKAMDQLKAGVVNILIGTDVAARGIDVKNIDIVFNYDIPYDVEYYIHRIGRTGRAGKTGIAITFVNNKKQREQLNTIMEETKGDIQEHIIPGLSVSKEKAGRKSDKRFGDKRRESKKSFSKSTSNKKEKTFRNSYPKKAAKEDKLDKEERKPFDRKRKFDKKTSGKNTSNKPTFEKKKEGKDWSKDKKFVKTGEKKAWSKDQKPTKKFSKPFKKDDKKKAGPQERKLPRRIF